MARSLRDEERVIFLVRKFGWYRRATRTMAPGDRDVEYQIKSQRQYEHGNGHRDSFMER